MSYADIHCHLLPAVDDGARDTRESIAYARRLVAEGVSEVVATPHIGHPVLGVDPAEVPDRVYALRDSLGAAGVDLKVHVGGELFPHGTGETADELLAPLAQGPEDARWLLIEVPFAGVDVEFVAECRTLMARGYGLVIAHPERARGLLEGGWELVEPLVSSGALLQVDVCSLLGNNGLEAQQAAEALIRGGQAFVIASDAHPGTREHTVALGFALAMRAGASSVQAWRLTQANPRFLLESGIPKGPVGSPFARPQVSA